MQGEELELALLERQARNIECANKELAAELAALKANNIRVNKETQVKLRKALDEAGDNILEPGGREHYRTVLDAHTDAKVLGWKLENDLY